MFTSWQVRCGIADYAAHLTGALNRLDDVCVTIVPFDWRPHPRGDYVRWGEQMNAGDVAHVQHEYSFFGYLLPWRNHFDAFARRIHKPLVITRHVSFDGPLAVPGRGVRHVAAQAKWSLYNRWLGPYARYLNKDIFDRAQQVIVLSARLKAHLVARGVSPDKIHVIPAGAPDVHPASPEAARALRAAWGWEDAHVVCQFGYIAPPKGHMLALEALARLPDDYVLLIAGGVRLESQGWYLDALRRRIAQLGLDGRVRITGYLNEADVARHIAASDLLIYPNTHADFSYSVVTGLAHRTTPALASDVDSHREIAGYCDGLALFRSGDADHLAGQIRRIIGDPAERRRMLEAAEHFVRDYAWPEIAKRTREVYRLCRPITPPR
ncbi:MAG: hypothetical protein KatS3mg053_3849 [Candidatus Roseilinea sp.]|nr:MAG: hypothetical protein KatS3mg053_3849 [Candidatus Roseilinea sp.]